MLPFEPLKNIFITLYFISLFLGIYGGIENLFLKRISKFGLDMIIIQFLKLFEKGVVNRISKDSVIIRRIGIVLLINAIIGIWLLPEFLTSWK